MIYEIKTSNNSAMELEDESQNMSWGMREALMDSITRALYATKIELVRLKVIRLNKARLLRKGFTLFAPVSMSVHFFPAF